MLSADEVKRNVTVHPLVLINICDHFTRTNQDKEEVVGALFGIQSGLCSHIYDSCELLLEKDSGALDIEFLLAKTEQVQRCYPDHELLGWYSTGVIPSKANMKDHLRISTVNESPLFLLLNPLTKADSQEQLPISMYESVVHVLNDAPTSVFMTVEYKIEASEVERITSQVTSTKIHSSRQQACYSIMELNRNLENSITQLCKKIEILEQFLQKTKAGVIEKDHCLLRQITSITSQLPLLNGDQAFQSELERDFNDTYLVTCLATVTHGAEVLNSCMDKVAISSTRGHSV